MSSDLKRKSGVYITWRKMIERCNNPNAVNYYRYGGRGISTCPEWLIFENFHKDMGDRPIRMEIDRIDNDKGYYKNNCRWVGHQTNCRNRKTTILDENDVAIIKSMLKYGGKKQKEIASIFGVKEISITQIKAGRRWADIGPLPI